MDALLELAVYVFVVAQVVGIALGILMMIGAVIYVIWHSWRESRRYN
jgi:hypothetical protein